MSKLNVLVLGVGGNVSQGILKALALSRVPHRVIGACISPLALGLYTTDTSYVSPTVYDPAFPDWLLEVCLKERVHAVLSGVEPVLTVLSRNAETIRQRTGAVCVVSDPTLLGMAMNKLATCRWLKEHGLNYPRYAPSEDREALDGLAAQCGYPLIAKLCAGKGSHGILDIQGPQDLDYISGKVGYVVQEVLGGEDTEYTVGCFSDRGGRVRGVISMRRELLQGTTYRAETGEFPEVRAEAIRIAEALKPMGPCNVQLRISDGRPTCFEINLRFSGTTPVRARLGFNDVEAALNHYVLNRDIEDLPLVRKGIVLRYWNEMYIHEDAAASLREKGRLEDPGMYPLLVEDYGVRK